MHKKIKHILCLALTLPTVFATACGGGNESASDSEKVYYNANDYQYEKKSDNLVYFESSDSQLDFFLNDYFKRHAGGIYENGLNQKVISAGLYGIVRHPMYLATLLMFLPMPLILGSFFGLIPFMLYPIIIVIRILGEEKLLTKELSGYAEYKTKTKYRLIPFVW